MLDVNLAFSCPQVLFVVLLRCSESLQPCHGRYGKAPHRPLDGIELNALSPTLRPSPPPVFLV